MLRRQLLGLSLILFVGAACAEEKPRDDVERLQGVWVVTKAEEAGAEDERSVGAAFTFEKDKLKLHFPNGWSPKATFLVEPDHDPRRIVYTILDEAGEKVVNSFIYKFEEDQLVLCGRFEARPGRMPAAPREFKTRPGSDAFLLVLERRK